MLQLFAWNFFKEPKKVSITNHPTELTETLRPPGKGGKSNSIIVNTKTYLEIKPLWAYKKKFRQGTRAKIVALLWMLFTESLRQLEF